MNWEQLKAIIWVRWRLSRNQFLRAGAFNAVLSILMGVALAAGCLGLAVLGVLGGAFGLAKAPGDALLVAWDVIILLFLAFWLLGLITEIQRSESMDLSKLLHLPITLRQVFAFNYLASHFSPIVLLFVPGMLSLCVGLALGIGPRFLLLMGPVAGVIFMITAWTYCLRGWLAALMVNKRRRRAIVVWITVVIVLGGQLPNLIFNSGLFNPFRNKGSTTVASRAGDPRFQGPLNLPLQLIQAHIVVPPGWIGYSAGCLKNGELAPVILASSAGFLLGFLGLWRAYQMTLNFYRGSQKRGEKTALVAETRPRPNGKLLVERRFLWFREDTGAMAMATLRALMRSPEIKMGLLLPLVAGIAFCAIQFGRPRGVVPAMFTGIVPVVTAAVALMASAQTTGNVFGLDRGGFRALVLLPTPRDRILAAKNLAYFPITGIIALVLLVLAKISVRMPWTVFVGGLLQIPTAILMSSLITNLLSIFAPYRINQGTLKASKPKAIVFIAGLLGLLVMPLTLAPLAVPAGLQILFSFEQWVPWLPIHPLASAVMLGAAFALYRLVLPIEGRLLQRREQAILKEVTEETE